MTAADETVATSLARIEGKFDLFTEKVNNIQQGMREIKDATRQDRQAAIDAMRDHVVDINPHPGLEMWVREIYKAHDERLKRLEGESFSRKQLLALLAFLLTFACAVAGVIVSFYN